MKMSDHLVFDCQSYMPYEHISYVIRGAAAHQLGDTSSDTMTGVKQC